MLTSPCFYAQVINKSGIIANNWDSIFGTVATNAYICTQKEDITLRTKKLTMKYLVLLLLAFSSCFRLETLIIDNPDIIIEGANFSTYQGQLIVKPGMTEIFRQNPIWGKCTIIERL